MIYLFLIRHGQTEWTREKKYQGNTDIPLDDVGEAQARALKKRIDAFDLDLFYVSPLERAQTTARILSQGTKKKLFTDARLREMAFGKWEGKSGSELIESRDPSFKKWMKGTWISPPGGEAIPSFQQRIRSFLDDMIAKHSGKKIGVVFHGGAIKMMIYTALNWPLRSLWSLRVDPSSLSLLHLTSGFRQLVFLNDRTHLENHSDEILFNPFEKMHRDASAIRPKLKSKRKK